MAETYAVIMAGGAGTRFWPASRQLRPKQLLGLSGNDGTSLLEATLARIAPIAPAARTYVVTAARLAEATRRQCASVPSANILAEPCPRNTAAAVGWAASVIARES